MKKFLLVCFMLCAASVFGEDNTVLSKWEDLSKEAFTLAAKIIASNKPAFEHKLTRQERTFDSDFLGKGTSPVRYERVWAKEKTIVTAWAVSDKHFLANSITTADPNFSFCGIHTGSTVKDLENYFGAPVSTFNEVDTPGIIWGSTQSEEGFMILINHKDDIITQISVSTIDWTGGFPVPISEKIHEFVADAMNKMNMPGNSKPLSN